MRAGYSRSILLRMLLRKMGEKPRVLLKDPGGHDEPQFEEI
jgi:hypothetical protein